MAEQQLEIHPEFCCVSVRPVVLGLEFLLLWVGGTDTMRHDKKIWMVKTQNTTDILKVKKINYFWVNLDLL